ncbi:hypothetical protein AHF37_08663 [Paragonimus kellicotti]|nr:hypothetical protein AHF37_08663 [Paragonimus kellicotti]
MPARKSTARKSVGMTDDPEERNFVNPSAVSPHLSCPICQEVFVCPQRAPCGHTFCKTCILPWIDQNPVCPVDRKKLCKENLYHDFLIENIIGDYMVACPWRSLGCDFIGPLHLLQSHKKSCFMNPELLPPALRNHTTALLSRLRTENTSAQLTKYQPASRKQTNNDNTVEQTVNETSTYIGSCSNSPTTSHSVGVTEQGQNAAHVNDEGANLPPTPPPNLLFRLYQNSDAESRNLLCNFIDSSPVNTPSPKRAPKRRRAAKR